MFVKTGGDVIKMAASSHQPR